MTLEILNRNNMEKCEKIFVQRSIDHYCKTQLEIKDLQ